MPMALSAEAVAALEARRLVLREFIWIVARHRETGDPVSDGYYSDDHAITCNVIDPDTGSEVERTFYGAAGYISRSAIARVSNLSVQNVAIDMSQIATRVNELLRTYDVKQARVQIFQGLLDPDTRELVAPPRAIFVGFVDKVEIVTPAEGQEGKAVLHCASHTQELTRSNPDTRSDASQRLRSETDDGFADVVNVGDWVLPWGRAEGKVPTRSASVWQGVRDSRR